jgi:hypothetical protein
MSSPLKELYDDATSGKWHVSTHVSDSIERELPSGTKQSLMFMCSVPTGQQKHEYQSLQNARLVVVMHEVVPDLLALMEAAKASNNLTVRKCLKKLDTTIQEHYDVAKKVGLGTWREADLHGQNKYADLSVLAKKLDDPSLGKIEKRKLRRKLRKERRERERAEAAKS